MPKSDDAFPGSVSDAAPGSPMPRRSFLGSVTGRVLGAAALPMLSACATGAATPPPAPGGASTGPPVSVSGNTLVLHLPQLPSLAETPGFYLVESEQVAIVRVSDSEYRAFTSICTHEGCDVSSVVDGILLCPCHGSEYDLEGRPVAGPAEEPLTRYATTLDASGEILTITIG